MDRAHGVDISVANGTFDYNVKRDDIQFVIIKASNGVRWHGNPKQAEIDKNIFEQLVKATVEVPIRGAYHYFRSVHSPINKQITFPWKEQADFFLGNVTGKRFDFFALDFEVNTFGNKTDNIVDDDFSNNAREWMDYVFKESDGKPLVIYTNLSLYGQYKAWMEKWPLWLANPCDTDGKDLKANPGKPSGGKKWRIWQYAWADKGEEYGVASHKIDLNVYNGTLEEMRQWLKLDIVEAPEEKKQVTVPPTKEPGEADSATVITWNQVRKATRAVAKRRGVMASTWFREAGIRDEMKDKARRKNLYDGNPVEKWQISPSEDRDQILAEILAQLGQKQEKTDDGHAEPTWGDVRAATRKVAKRRGVLASTWFREAGIRDEMKDKARRKQPYDGKPVEKWEISPVEDRDQILAEILAQPGLEQLSFEQAGLEQLSFAGPEVEQFSFEVGASGDGDAEPTWGDVRAATKKVAKRRGVRASTWFREAGIRDEMKDKSRRKEPYDGKPVEKWEISPVEDRDQILAAILAQFSFEQPGPEELSFAGTDFEQFSFEVGVSGGSAVVNTWGDVRAATRAVAKRRGALAATWFREAGIRDEMKDKSRRNKPYQGKPVEEWPLTPSGDRNQILAEILAQLGQNQGESAGVAADVTWGDVRAATRKVAKKHGVLASTWFREAGIRDQMKDKARREKPYDGEPINNWSVSITLRAEIIKNLDEKKSIFSDPDPGGDQGIVVQPTGDLIKLDVPYISQYDDEAGDHSADCGPTCLAMIIRANPAPADPVTVDGLYSRHLRKHKGNTFWSHLRKMSSEEDLSPELKRNQKAQALRDLRTLIRNGHPVIVLVNYGHWPFAKKNYFNGYHFVLVTGFDEKNFYVHDPLFGQFSSRSEGAYCQLSNHTFLRGWEFPESENTPFKRMAMTNKVVPFLSD